MAVDVVVINYRTPDLLEGFCTSYERHEFDGCTLTVVDVTMDSPYPEQLAEKHGAEFIRFEENVGYARACNEGARCGVNDVILLANADTLLSEGFEECYQALMANPDWGVLGPRQVNEHNQITAGGIIGDDRSPAQRGWNEQDVGQYSDVLDSVLSVSGSLYFIKRKVWEELTSCPIYREFTGGAEGAFLPTKHYFEEMHCSLHARAHGYKCVYYGPVQMAHYWHKSSPHGGAADMEFAASQQMHREACRAHGISCE